MKAQFTLYVDDNMNLSFDIEGENMRDLLNQADKFEKIGFEWGEEALDRKPLTARQRISRKIFPFVVLIEGVFIGVVISQILRLYLGIHIP